MNTGCSLLEHKLRWPRARTIKSSIHGCSARLYCSRSRLCLLLGVFHSLIRPFHLTILSVLIFTNSMRIQAFP